jgi:hypothetical protein
MLWQKKNRVRNESTCWGSLVLAGSALVLLGGIAGCQSAGRAELLNSNVRDAVQRETPTTQRGELAARGFEAWSKGAGLSADQKSKLFSIHTNTAREAFRIRDEISQTKSALYKELAKGDYNPKMVDSYKNKIISLDQERIDIMLKALASVETTLGRGAEAQKYYEYLDKIENQYFREH